MRMKLLFVWSFLFCHWSWTGLAATIEGVVSVSPQSKGVAVQKRYKAAPNAAEPEAQRAIIYLEGDFSGAAKPSTNILEMRQLKYQFNPGILPVQTGTTVLFPNQDDDYHNVFSYSKPKRFDLGRYRKDEKPPSQVFDKPGVVKLFCEIHEHMRATILVLDSPYFAKADEAGKFKLKGVPPGKYKVKAWIEENQVLTKEVEVKEGETLKVDFGPQA